MIKEFLESNEPEAFITGPAGSGKTTALKATVEYLNELGINYLVTAYTHKAKEVLISKLPEGTPIRTLHSWLKKRPGINSKAKHIQHIMTNRQQGKPEHLQLLIVDEFSFINEEDYMSIGELQDELNLTTYHCKDHGEVEYYEDEKDGLCCPGCHGDVTEVIIPPIKVLYVGDLNQLSPVKGWSAVSPCKPFWTELTVVYRNSTQLLKPLTKLVRMIEGKEPISYLQPNEDFVRNIDIDKHYKLAVEDSIMLAYTNKAVEEHNRVIQGRSVPIEGDIIYIPTLRCDKQLVKIHHKPIKLMQLTTPMGLITSETKYNPFKTLGDLNYVKYYEFEDGTVVPGIFGSYQNKLIRDELGKSLVAKNKNNMDSIKEYKLYKCINDYVSIMDFNHCMTIHKSQGSEFDYVFIDSADLAICKDINEQMKLLYVAISRARYSVYLNN